MRRIKIAMYGTGAAHAIGTLITLQDLNDYFDFVGVCEPNPVLKQEAERLDWYKDVNWITEQELFSIDELDAVAVEVEELRLTQAATFFAKRNFHIYMDKPGGESVEEFEELINTMKNTGRVFYTGYMYRHNPSVIKTKELVAEGTLGDITSVEAQMSIKYKSTESLSKYKGGITYFLGCHLIDLVYSILGEPKKICPHSSYLNNEVHTLDYGLTAYEYDKGVSFIKTNATEVNGFERRQIVVTGTKGTVEIRPVELFDKVDTLYLTSEMKISIEYDGKVKEEIIKFPKYKRYDDMFMDFARCVIGEKVNDYSYDYELGLHRLIMKSF